MRYLLKINIKKLLLNQIFLYTFATIKKITMNYKIINVSNQKVVKSFLSENHNTATTRAETILGTYEFSGDDSVKFELIECQVIGVFEKQSKQVTNVNPL